MNLKNAIVRTLTPIIVGAIASWFLQRGIDMDEGNLEDAIGPVIAGGYYIVVRLVSQRWPSTELLLGSRATPEYDQV